MSGVCLEMGRAIQPCEERIFSRTVPPDVLRRHEDVHDTTCFASEARMHVWQRTLLWFALASLLVFGSTSTVASKRSMRLKPCPSSPNCVSSEADPSDKEHYVAPLTYTGMTTEQVVERLHDVVGTMKRAKLVEEKDLELHYTFTTLLFRFVDDVDLVVVPDDAPSTDNVEAQVIDARATASTTSGTVQVRSASRVGYSDLGTNRRRVEDIRERWNQATPKTHASKM